MSLPEWLDPLPDAEQMRATDAWAIEQEGIPSLELMEVAGSGLADLVVEVAPQGPVLIVCGGGDNGGDGFVSARLLREAGREVTVALTTDPDKLQGDAKANFGRLPGEGPRAFEPQMLDEAEIVVDAILGTGFSGAVREPARSAIVALNESSAPVIACDVPSGVDASTGAIGDVAVRAVGTATFHRAKPGLWIAPGKEHAGLLRVIDIGIPANEPIPAGAGIITPHVTEAIPRRAAASTKFSSGHVLVVGGSTGLTGAPCLSAEGAMRAGAGYVTCCVPSSLNLVFEQRLLEVMTIPLPDDDGHLTEQGVDRALGEADRRGGAMVIGPGFGRAEGAIVTARALTLKAGVPVVLDADGLNAHAGDIEALSRRTAPTVITPHAGELARLLAIESDAVGRRRLDHARQAARRANAVVVLKGDDTIVAEPGGHAGVSPGGAPALATAGTGDVLSGVLAAMLAKGLEPFHAACAAVRLHLDAGRTAARSRRPDAVIASDVIDALGR